MEYPVLVPNNNWNGSQQNHNQTCTKQRRATTRDNESTPIRFLSDPSSSINTVEMLNSNDILQAALRPFTILKYKTYQKNGTINACKIIYHICTLK